MRRPVVTVGIPFYNAESTLPDAIRSVFAQTFRDWELILVDDGSSDGSLKIAQAVVDPRVRVVSDGSNRGLASRLNEIARLALGRYIARMDADDIMHPERLACQIEYLEANPEVDVVGTGVYAADVAGNPVGARGLSPLSDRPETALRHGLMIHPTITGRAEWFRRNPYDEDESFLRIEDHELWCRTVGTSVFATLQRPLLFYREGGAASLKNYLDSSRAQRRIFRMYGPRIVGRWRTVLLVLSSHLKGMVFAALTLIGLQSVLLRRRSRRLDGRERAEALQVLDTVLRTDVPGLAPGRGHAVERNDCQ